MYAASESMAPNTVFYSSDGDYLVIPQAGTLDIQTELGNLLVRQNEIVVIPRGIRYRVDVVGGSARGYICELYQGHFQLPELGPIGSCSLANARDFQIPIAQFSGSISNGIASCEKENWTIVTKFAGSYFRVRRIIRRLISLLGMGRTIRTSMILGDLVLLEVYSMTIQIPVSSPSLPHLRTVSRGLRYVISRFSRRGGW